ncbi:AAA family ATPase [Paenibacillus sp. YPG26]|uniref:AAA family ATPase n=1 Tax=Paenibacillus sp. YPG26 TaxID=2878915 RepID=UPI00203FB6B0|nr:AAA family ATPase [Paenibacillus sp. YPG26]USB34446.1 AAA family ATPase [Paenibacillus sp. YPG26]
MKPISLKLSGLQSYREPQEVDFTQLCETGLFGIFGPTGSGKSTLLDAITLALYGKVERAVNGTQGIMNHSEDSLFVAFTFELMSADGAECYRVERRFKRTGDVSISNTISRFIQVLPEGDQVHADKLSEVTRCVEEKIGLKMDDFTRAVVLPQGKFAEFLSLKGSERRQMLQRLFHLEKYGDHLGMKLSRKVKETDSRLKELAAEQQGLGLASEEALQEAAGRLKAAAAEAELRRRELQEAERLYEQLAKLRELGAELAQRKQSLLRLQEQSGEVAQLEARLAQAAAAEQLRPALGAWRDARRLAAERSELAQQAAAAAASAEAAAAQAAEAAELARQALAAEEPGLLVRLDQLEQARGLQTERDALKREQAGLQSRLTEAARALSALTEQITKEELLLAKAVQRRQELERRLKDVEVPSVLRRKVQTAASLKERFIELASRRTKADHTSSDLKERLVKADNALKEARQLESVQLESRSQAAEQAAGLIERFSSLMEICQDVLEGLVRREHTLRHAVKSQELQLWSARLAEQLIDGEACPVCGSDHHPIPAGHVLNEAEQLEGELEQIAASLSATRDMKYSLSRGFDTCRTLLESLIPPGDQEVMLQAAAGHSTATLPKLAEEDHKFNEQKTHKEWAAEMNKAQKDLSTAQEHLKQLQQVVKEVRDSHDALQPRLAGLSAELAALQNQFDQSLHIRDELAREQTELTEKWNQELPDCQLADTDSLVRDIHEKDSVSEDVKKRLELSGPFIEEKTVLLRSLTQEAAELDKQQVQLQAQLAGKTELLIEKEGRLHVLAGNEAVDKLLLETADRLELLRRQAAALQEQHMTADQVKQETAKSSAAAQQTAIAALEQEQQLRSGFEQQLEMSPFTREEDTEQALLDPATREKLEERIRTHRDLERELAIQTRELESKLAGRQIHEEEWESCKNRLAEGKAADEMAVQSKARAERDLEDMEVRHVRWKELESDRVKLSHSANLLSKLQSSLRGNAFVEYIAEEQLMNVSRAASQRLRDLTKQRYSLETDSGGGFIICDDANGGIKRPVSTLSGGETFLTSLALALALSAQIQLRGQYPLQFFFLDEGFGTLDPELLDTVITSLEQLHHDHLAVGVISHVAELRARLPRKLVVVPAENAGSGSRIMLEHL